MSTYYSGQGRDSLVRISTTCDIDAFAPGPPGGFPIVQRSKKLLDGYQNILDASWLHRTQHRRLLRRLGAGSHGVVFLIEQWGVDGFRLPGAVKVFSPQRYEDARTYYRTMERFARVVSHIAKIQQDHLLTVHGWFKENHVRIMDTEWIDGFDLRCLLTSDMLECIENRVAEQRWQAINDVVVTAGPEQPRLKPGIAIQIVRDCLAALAALHAEGIVHGDVKPSNIMLKRTGSAKLVDFGAAFEIDAPPSHRTCTPVYAAMEVLLGDHGTPQSDLAGLGYTLVEMLDGRPLFAECPNYGSLLEAKRRLPEQLPHILPEEVVRNELLMNFCQRLISPDPAQRFPSAEDADFDENGAASFHRQLVKVDLAGDYDKEIRHWLKELDDLNCAVLTG